MAKPQSYRPSPLLPPPTGRPGSTSTTPTAGVMMKIAKKASGIPSVTHDEALDVALCYGWIDGVRRSLDDQYFLQKFTPRRARSLWSKRNIDKVAALGQAGRMHPAGLARPHVSIPQIILGLNLRTCYKQALELRR